MTSLTFDPQRSKLTIETRAVGLLGKLAHDLSIVTKTITATAELRAEGVDLELGAPVADLSVDGVRKGGNVDRTVLSASDRADIEKKIRTEVLATKVVTVKASVPALPKKLGEEGSQSVDVELDVVVGAGKQRVRARIDVATSGSDVVASGHVALDLHQLGIKPPKGPLGAFKVDAVVGVDLELTFRLG
jgi:hypothetical protein